MSTEGSVSTSSSGIRQFGLYRTIDARTEEFLRLSRKRQIRQGCACAAISTAITVTIVITMILIYEYSIFHESSSKTSIKQHWLSLMNKSAQEPFEVKLNKAKINFDPVYVQFLPRLLKILKKNKYFDSIIEDESTHTPLYAKGEVEDLYTKNIFSDSRNWMLPTSRLYTIEYKTSPIVYFKYPTRNVEHFTKIRRIRDYQRIMNYVDKMISEKTSTISMFKNTYSFYKKPAPVNYASTTPMTTVVEYVTKKQTARKKLKLQKVSKQTSKLRATKMNSACRCPKKISHLLGKLIKSLQKIIPDFIKIEQNMSSCNEKKLNKTNKYVTQQLEHTTSRQKSEEAISYDQSNEISSMTVADYTNIDQKNTKSYGNSEIISVPLNDTLKIPKLQLISTLKNYQTTMPTTISKTFYSMNPLYPKLDYTLNSLIKSIKPHTKIQLNHKNTSYTTTKQFIEGTDANYYLPESTTRPMLKTTSTSTKTSTYTIKTVRDLILQESNLNSTVKSLENRPELSDSDYTDYYTTPNMVENVKILDERGKEKNRKGETDLNLDPTYYNKQEFKNTWNILSKMEKLAFSLNKIQNISHKYKEKLNDTTNTKIVTEKENSGFVTESILRQSSIKTYLNLNENKIEEQMKDEDVTLEEEIDKASSEEIVEESSLQNLGKLINKINVSKIFNRTLKKEKDKSTLDRFGQILFAKHKDTSCQHLKSMLPENRPTYLEIRRNDWKRDDEQQDYDSTVNNNYFP